MNKPLWIQDGQIIDPANGRNERGDLFVLEGKIVAELSAKEKKQATVLPGKGRVVCPGFIDLHTHLREPGDTHKETIETGTRAAAAGGYTSLVCQSNTKPPADNAGTIQLIKDSIARTACVHVFPTGCLTINREGKSLAPIGSLKKAGVVAVSDGGHCIQNNEIMRRAAEYAHMFGLSVLDHCQDAGMTDGCVMHEGEWSLRLGLRGIPSAAEDIMVSRNVILSSHHGVHIHLQHISSSYSVDTIRRAKQRKINITAEATPHHLALTDEALKSYNTHCKMVPPLRGEEDRQSLIAGLLDGAIDCIATAHAPHTSTEKDREFDFAPFGAAGLETAFSVCYESLVQAGHCDLPFLIGCLTYRAANVLKLPKGTLSPGADADITILDPDETWKVTPEAFFSSSHNSPWLGRTLPGKVKATLVNGRPVYSEGAFLPLES